MSEMFCGGLLNLKFEPCIVKLVCHEVGQKCVPCLDNMYCLCIGLVEMFGKDMFGKDMEAKCKKNYSINVLWV